MQQTFDAIVVGSGATGGWVAKQLTEAGLDVARQPVQSRCYRADRVSGHRPRRRPGMAARVVRGTRDLHSAPPVTAAG